LHGICGDKSSEYGEHPTKDIGSIKWHHICFNCAEERASGTSAANRTSTALIVSRRPSPAEQARYLAAGRQRRQERREERQREYQEAEESFASHEVPSPKDPEREAAVAASFALTTVMAPPRRGYGPSSRMATPATIHINQNRRAAEGDPPPVPVPAPVAAVAAAAPEPAAEDATGGGGMLVEPFAAQIPDIGMYAGVQGPSMRLVANTMYQQRLIHEESRPKRTQGTYGTFFEKYWKRFCDSKDGDTLDGVTISGKGHQKWDYLVTPAKAYMFMSLYSLKRQKRKGGEGNRSKKSVRNDLAKIADLYQRQKVTPDT